VTATLPSTRFTLPVGSEAGEPPERRGLTRDGVRLLVAGPSGVTHHHFHELPDLLRPGDLLVINTSATRPAALVAVGEDGGPALLHLSTVLDDGSWVIEIRRPDGSGPDTGRQSGAALDLPDGLRMHLLEPYPRPGPGPSRLWRAVVDRPVPIEEYLAAYGGPIEYGYLRDHYPLTDRQTVYATWPGSAEMPSAGRPFTASLIVRLTARGIAIAPVVLHAGVSSPEAHEPPTPERYTVPPATAHLVRSTRQSGGRVIAVGTTAVRALETATDPAGEVGPGSGWTDLVVGPDRPVRAVSGLITGLHAPEASHLLMLEAVVGLAVVSAAYEAAIANGYLWHEFGDSCLLLPN